jgi:hypothetical protein
MGWFSLLTILVKPLQFFKNIHNAAVSDLLPPLIRCHIKRQHGIDHLRLIYVQGP